jgi:hypothetical protein
MGLAPINRRLSLYLTAVLSDRLCFLTAPVRFPEPPCFLILPMQFFEPPCFLIFSSVVFSANHMIDIFAAARARTRICYLSLYK